MSTRADGSSSPESWASTAPSRRSEASKQKTIGAKNAGADVFVVPQGNYEEAKKYSDGLELIPVQTFNEALADLGATPSAS